MHIKFSTGKKGQRQKLQHKLMHFATWHACNYACPKGVLCVHTLFTHVALLVSAIIVTCRSAMETSRELTIVVSVVATLKLGRFDRLSRLHTFFRILVLRLVRLCRHINLRLSLSSSNPLDLSFDFTVVAIQPINCIDRTRCPCGHTI